jgi:hypothetical protein
MYITPRVLIQQEFLQLPVYREFPLPAFIIGPHFALTRYNVPSEKPFTALATFNGDSIETGNSYNPTVDTTYDIPNIPAGGDVDPTYTKVYAEAVEAQYFPLEELMVPFEGADAISLLTAPSGKTYSNRIKFENITLVTANGYSRSDVFSNRDVRVNDIIELSDNLGNIARAKIVDIDAETSAINPSLNSAIAPEYATGGLGVVLQGSPKTLTDAQADFVAADVVGKYITFTLSGQVRKIIACPTPTTLTLDAAMPAGQNLDWVIGGVYNDQDNAKLSVESFSSFSFTGTEGDDDNVTAENVSEAYKGYSAKGLLEDTYTIKVTTAGSKDTVRFTVSSLNGAFNPKLNVALTGTGQLSVDEDNGNVLVIDFNGSTSFVLNSTWELSVVAPYTPVNPATGGTYTGPVDMTYTVRVERGGAFYNGTNSTTCARLIITASDVDTSTVVLPSKNTAFNVGGFGVTAIFAGGPNNDQLVLGDVYYIPVLASKAGPMTIVDLSEDLPEQMILSATSITAKLFLTQKSILIPEVRDMLTDDRNWSQEDYMITLNAGITTYDPNLVTGATPARLPIVVAKMFVEHRDLLQDYVTAIDSVRSLADVERKLGTIHPDNPLAQGVYDAVLNAQNMIVYFVGVQTNDLSGYTQAIKISEKSDKVYSFVPMTFDRPIQDAIVSHVNAYSTPEVGRWRIAWIAVPDNKTAFIYDTKEEDGSSYYATITDDPAVSNTQYRYVTIAGAKLIEDGVRPNDTIRINFRLNADGKLIYDEYVVDRVRTNSSLIITKPLAAPINTPVKVQVVRNYTKSERASNIAHVGGDFNNRRVRCVFPDTYKYGGVTKQGYFAAAGLAGLRSGVVPHQGLTNSEFLGADDLTKVVIDFSQDDLNTMAEQGIWLITQEVIGATPYVRHQLTTDERSLNTSEDSITTNVDNISYALKATLTPFIGRYNINPENILALRSAISGQLRFRATSTWTARAGNQLVSFDEKRDIIRLEQNSTYKDRVDVEVLLNVPYPMNYIALKLIVG